MSIDEHCAAHRHPTGGPLFGIGRLRPVPAGRSGVEAASLTEELLPDLVLIDLEERNGDRADAIRRIKQTAGADGYVTKFDADERLKALI
jgi:CheY-like chemotaxis protein